MAVRLGCDRSLIVWPRPRCWVTDGAHTSRSTAAKGQGQTNPKCGRRPVGREPVAGRGRRRGAGRRPIGAAATLEHHTNEMKTVGFTPAATQPTRSVPLPDTNQPKRGCRKKTPDPSAIGVPDHLEPEQFEQMLECIADHHNGVERTPGAGALQTLTKTNIVIRSCTRSTCSSETEQRKASPSAGRLISASSEHAGQLVVNPSLNQASLAPQSSAVELRAPRSRLPSASAAPDRRSPLSFQDDPPILSECRSVCGFSPPHWCSLLAGAPTTPPFLTRCAHL